MQEILSVVCDFLSHTFSMFGNVVTKFDLYWRHYGPEVFVLK